MQEAVQPFRGLGLEPDLGEALLGKLTTSLVVGDLQVALHSVKQAGAARICVDRRCYCPFGGALLHPLQAAVCSPLEPAACSQVVRCLLAAGARANIAWVDVAGCHTPLSKALAMRNLPLAELLAAHGADCTAALLRTDLLERSRFDPLIVRWLLDRGADAASPLQPSFAAASGPLACREGRRLGPGPCSPSAEAPGSSEAGSSSSSTDGHASSSSSGSSGDGDAASSSSSCALQCQCPPVPAVAVLLSKLATELHVSRQLSKLHAAAGSGQEAWLLRRAAGCLQRLLAAGAAPVGALDPSDTVSAAVDSLQPADWEAVRQYATEPLVWSPQTHHLFPRAFQLAAREVLLVARRGFSLPPCGGTESSSSGSSSCSTCSGKGASEAAPEPVGSRHSSSTAAAAAEEGAQQEPGPWWLDGGIVLCVIQQMAPSNRA